MIQRRQTFKLPADSINQSMFCIGSEIAILANQAEGEALVQCLCYDTTPTSPSPCFCLHYDKDVDVTWNTPQLTSAGKASVSPPVYLHAYVCSPIDSSICPSIASAQFNSINQVSSPSFLSLSFQDCLAQTIVAPPHKLFWVGSWQGGEATLFTKQS